MADQDSRILLKRSTVASELPSIAPSSDHTDGTWSKEHIYIGELFANVADDRLFFRTTGGIQEIALQTSGTTSDVFFKFMTASSAEILALNSTPLDVIDAPGAGKAIVIETVTMKINNVVTPYATTTQLELVTDTATNGQLMDTAILVSTVDRAGAGFIDSMSGTATTQVIENKKVVLLARGAGDPTAGDGDIELWINYRIINL